MHITDAVSLSTCMCLPMFVRLAQHLIHEAQMHHLHHPNIVALLAVIFEQSHYGIVLEYEKYGTLDGFIESYMVSFNMQL